MNKINPRNILIYLGVVPPILTVVLAQWGKTDAFHMLVWQMLVVFGYAATVYDIREKRVPNQLIGFMMGAWILSIVPQLFFQTEMTIRFLLRGVWGFLIGGLVFLVVYLVSRKGLGGGDVKLMAVSGLYLGIDGVLPAMLYGSVLAALTGIILILIKKIGKNDAIALVPFLYVGMILTMVIVL